MLYELVTGKPPFSGDSPTAIISQHINTPPVAPSWHSEHCPPDLESLILRLLAKVPGDRPPSALDVLASLEAVDGRGSVVMLVGEPGIGKTRTVQELSTYARMRGAKVLWGRAHEASGAP